MIWFIVFLLFSFNISAQDCEVLTAVDTTSAIELGNGTAGSITTTDIQLALNAGGMIRFNQGAVPTTINITSELIVTRDVVLDGQGLITLNGMNQNRILKIENPSNLTYNVTVQNMRFINGNSGMSGNQLTNSGAAIFKGSGGPWQAVNLHVINVEFNNNNAIQVHQDGGGGAIYIVGMNNVLISDSIFINNSGSNGGAFYSLGSQNIRITDSVFDNNQATGNNGNPGNGGNAGAIGIDGGERSFNLCRSQVINNNANAFGTGFFSVMYDELSLTAFVDSLFENNVNSGDEGLGGGAYIQGGPFIIEGSSFIENQSPGAGGLFFGPDANGMFVNSTIFGNIATNSLGGGMSISASATIEILHLTIINNLAPCDVCFAAGISLSSTNFVSMGNTIIANNVGGNLFNPWNIRYSVSDNGGNLQFPQQRPNGQSEPAATASVFWGDPLISTPTYNGGHTPTMEIDTLSPAINQANQSMATETDQRGASRYQQADIGAYEKTAANNIFSNGFE
jgi:hypothetical protein